MIRQILAHPLTAGMDLDDPATTNLRRQIIAEKPFLRRIYSEWYEKIAAHVPSFDAPALELGSGAGFLSEHVPNLITSEIMPCAGVRIVLDAQAMPFETAALRAIVMTNVLHHLPEPVQFFREATRCLRLGGTIVLIEPWVSAWSRLVYARLHHEPFLPDAEEWSHSFGGPVSGANGALPWILFERDRQRFAREFPRLRLKLVEPFMPFRYLISGGVSMKNLMPGALFPLWKGIEEALNPWRSNWAMFAFVVVERVG